jgi:hypothetical protein
MELGSDYDDVVYGTPSDEGLSVPTLLIKNAASSLRAYGYLSPSRRLCLPRKLFNADFQGQGTLMTLALITSVEPVSSVDRAQRSFRGHLHENDRPAGCSVAVRCAADPGPLCLKLD